MIKVQKYENMGSMKITWLHARYHFSFFRYHNPQKMGFGVVRVINDDVILAGGGFDTHHHADMEIISYVRKGAITHKDSEGNGGRIAAGDVQVMSAGTGVYHSEYNLESEDTVMYQIWIEPHTRGLIPRWDSARFPRHANENELSLLVSGRQEDADKGALYINQSASVYGGRLDEGAVVSYAIKDQVYILIAEGDMEVNGVLMRQGDGAEVVDEEYINIRALSISELVFVDAPAR